MENVEIQDTQHTERTIVVLPTSDISLQREHWMMIRQSLLMYLDAIEKALDISPRTSELRKEAKERDRQEKTLDN